MSVVAKAIRNSQLRELGRTLLGSLGWHGVAMVEFKRSNRDEEFYLNGDQPEIIGDPSTLRSKPAAISRCGSRGP